MTREDFIMSLAENITMVTILCIVAGLLIGWYVTQSYYKSHETSGGFVVEPSEFPPPPPPKKRYRKSWQFINLANAGDNQTLNRTVCMMSRKGYAFQPEASNAGVLAFMKLEEAPEATDPNELTDADIERLRKQAEEIRKEYESKKKQGTMTAKCIKADPLQWITVGETYECMEIGRNVMIEGTGMAMNQEQFNEMFEKL